MTTSNKPGLRGSSLLATSGPMSHTGRSRMSPSAAPLSKTSRRLIVRGPLRVVIAFQSAGRATEPGSMPSARALRLRSRISASSRANPATLRAVSARSADSSGRSASIRAFNPSSASRRIVARTTSSIAPAGARPSSASCGRNAARVARAPVPSEAALARKRWKAVNVGRAAVIAWSVPDVGLPRRIASAHRVDRSSSNASRSEARARRLASRAAWRRKAER